MKSSRILIGISLLLAGCASHTVFVALEEMPVASLTDSCDPVVMADTAAGYCHYATSLSQQLAAFKLAQEAYLAMPENPHIAMTLSRCAYFASELADDKEISYQLIRKGMEASWKAGADKKDPAAAFYYGVFWGQMIRKKGLTALGKLPELEGVFSAALKHPETEHGGPFRALGMLYLKAPAWPRSIGDLEKSLELLERGTVEFPNFPLNHFFYAQALVEDESFEDAEHHLQLAEKLVDAGDFGAFGDRWTGDIKAFRAKIGD